jgi:hypothetical protein
MTKKWGKLKSMFKNRGGNEIFWWGQNFVPAKGERDCDSFRTRKIYCFMLTTNVMFFSMPDWFGEEVCSHLKFNITSFGLNQGLNSLRH